MKLIVIVFQYIQQMKYFKKHNKFNINITPSILLYKNKKYKNLKFIEDEYNLKNE